MFPDDLLGGTGAGVLDGGFLSGLQSLKPSSSASSSASSSSGFYTNTGFGDFNVGAGAGGGNLFGVAALAVVGVVAWALLHK